MSGINWALGQIPDFTQAALSAEQAGRQRGRQKRTEGVLAAYGQDPDAAIEQAYAFDPELGDKLSQRRRDRQVQELIPQVLGGTPQGATMGGFGGGTFNTDGTPVSEGVQMPSQNGVQLNSAALQKLFMLDPERANQISTFASKARKEELDAVAAHGETKAKAANYLSRFPAGPDRDRAFQQMKPDLIARGFSEQDLNAARLDDESLKRDQVFGSTLAELRDEARVKWVPVGERGLAAFDAQGNPVGNDNPFNVSEAPTDLMAQAEAAIAAGADRAAVMARMQKLGGQGASPATFPGE